MLNAAWYQPRLTDWAFVVFNTLPHSSIARVLLITGHIAVSMGCTDMETAASAFDA